jgi:hypothetical protein
MRELSDLHPLQLGEGWGEGEGDVFEVGPSVLAGIGTNDHLPASNLLRPTLRYAYVDVGDCTAFGPQGAMSV